MTNKYIEKIKEYRITKGLSQDEVAKAIGVSRPTYTALESGKKQQLDLNEAQKLSNFFGISLDELVSGSFENIEKYMRGLKKAQMELDLRPEKYKHHFAGMIPERYRDKVDVRRFAVGERIVFLPYTQKTFQATQDWIHERSIFDHAPERVSYVTAVAGE